MAAGDPDVHERLQGNPPARVADIACEAGWSSIAIARAYPKAQVDGYDNDEASVELARANVTEAGLQDRVLFHVRDAAEQPSAGTGTVMRSDVLRAYAAEAGFESVEILPIEHDMWHFYRLLS